MRVQDDLIQYYARVDGENMQRMFSGCQMNVAGPDGRFIQNILGPFWRRNFSFLVYRDNLRLAAVNRKRDPQSVSGNERLRRHDIKIRDKIGRIFDIDLVSETWR